MIVLEYSLLCIRDDSALQVANKFSLEVLEAFFRTPKQSDSNSTRRRRRSKQSCKLSSKQKTRAVNVLVDVESSFVFLLYEVFDSAGSIVTGDQHCFLAVLQIFFMYPD